MSNTVLDQKPIATKSKPFKKELSAKPILITISLLYLFLILFIPAFAVFYEAFHKGFSFFLESFKDSNFINAIKLSVIVVGISVPVNTVFGVSLAWLLARNKFWGRTFLLSLLDVPFAISPVVAGLMIVLLYGKNNLLGTMLENWGFKVVFAIPGMVIATIFVTLPFVVKEVLPVLEEIGTEEEEAGRILGASNWQVFWKITLPNMRLGLLYGILLTNARAVGEFGAVSVVSGNIMGRTLTLPLFVEQSYKNYQTEVAFGASALLAGMAILTLIAKEILGKKAGKRTLH